MRDRADAETRDPYRDMAVREESLPPRWPALRGLAVMARFVFSRPGLRAAGIGLAIIFLPWSLALHGLRSLGGADPKRTDAVATAVRVCDVDGPAGPLPFILASMTHILVIVALLTGSL